MCCDDSRLGETGNLSVVLLLNSLSGQVVQDCRMSYRALLKIDSRLNERAGYRVMCMQ